MPRRRVTKKKKSVNETKKKSSGPKPGDYKRSDYKGSNIKLSAAAPEYIPLSYLAANEPIRSPSKNAAIAAVENAVAIDCEMVGVGPRKHSALAHVAVVDFNGRELYNKYVIPKGGIGAITNYRTQYSGIKPNTLMGLNSMTHSFERVRSEVLRIIGDRTIVGHGLINDFNALHFTPRTNLVWDTTIMPEYKAVGAEGILRPRRLKVLAKEIAGDDIQNESKKGHSPLEDARASMNLYRIAMGYPKVVYANMSK